MKILIVDDHSENRYLLKKLLEGNGYETLSAANGAETLTIALKSPPDMVVSDILMPVMDGFTLCSEWRKNKILKNIPFIFYTATYTSPKDKEFALSLGADRFIVKPFEMNAFLKVIKETFDAYKDKEVRPKPSHAPAEKVFLKEYNETLVRKLEDKMTQLEAVEKELREKNAALEKDIEERKQIDEALRESEEKHRTLFETMTQGVVYQGADGAIIAANKSTERILGLTHDQIMGRTSTNPQWKAIHEDGSDFPGNAHPSMVALKTGKEVQNVVMGVYNPQKKTHIWINICAVPQFKLGESTPYQVYTTFEDITDRKRAEEKIAEQARLLEVAIDTIIVRDINDRLLFWNKAAERLYGWTFEEACRLDVHQFVCKEDIIKYEKSKEEFFQKGSWEGEFHQRTKDGQLVITYSQWTLVRDRNGKPSARLIITRDVTEQRALESQLRRTQRLENLGTLAGGIAHDLNNVLAPILMATQVLEKRTTDPQIKSIACAMETNVLRGRDIIKQVLMFARGGEEGFAPQQLKYIIDEMVSIMRETFPRNIVLGVDVAKNLHTVLGDGTQLHQVLMNLCVNARDAMPNGGTLKISASNLTVDKANAGMHVGIEPGEYVLLNVYDTGMGILKEIQDKVFEPFFTTKEIGKGTGLGLSTVVSIIKEHKGLLKMSSEGGKGTEFKIYFPAVFEDMKAPNIEEEKAIQQSSGENILLVDDEFAILQISREALETYGYNVIMASNGSEAITAFSKVAKGSINLAIVDMNMPVMDGTATIAALRKFDPNIKIILSTGVSDEKDSAKLAHMNIQGYIMKPCTARKMLEAVWAVLHS